MKLQKWLLESLLWPAMERLKGNQIRNIQRQLEQSQTAAPCEIQRANLTKLLLHCRAHVPAYADCLPSTADIAADPYAALAALPPLCKAVFQAEPARYLADSVPPSARIANHTGGSTGQPVHFFMTRPQVEAYEAARWRGLHWYGITQGSRSVMLWGSPIELSRQARRKSRWAEAALKNRRILSAYALRAQALPKQLRKINRYRPEYLYGYASALTAFAQLLQESGEMCRLPLKAVVSTSETLEPWQKALLEQTFHCPVANEYGARDAGILAYSCPSGGLHITAENCLIEVLDPVTLAPLPVGQTGLLAVTDLKNFCQPRLRYLLGDMGALSAERCACGRALPLLLRVQGREDDLLLGRDGTLVHGNAVGQLLRGVAGIRAFQFRQHTPESATLLLTGTPPDAEALARILAQLHTLLPDTQVRVTYAADIPPTASGKRRYAIREFPLEKK